MIKKVLVTGILIYLMFTTLHGQESMADPLNLISARAAGVGKAYTALVNDATAIYWNPAAMSTLQDGQAGLVVRYTNSSFSISDTPQPPIKSWEIDTESLTDISFIGLAFPFSDGKDNTHIGIAVRKFVAVPPEQTEKIRTVDDETFGWQYQNSGSIYVFSAAVSVNIFEELSLGGAFNFFSGDEEIRFSNLTTTSEKEILLKNKQQYSRTSFHAGILYKYNPQWIFGMNLQLPHVLDRQQNVETDGNFEVNNTQIFFPLFLNIATAYTVNNNLTVTVDYFYRPWQKVDVKDGSSRYAFSQYSLNAFHLGTEYLPDPGLSPFALRLGYYYNPTVYKNNAGEQISHHVITTGIGWNKGGLSLNLGFEWIPFKYETGRLNTTIPGLPFEAPSTSFTSHAFQISLDFFVRIS